jgi:probable F420-dependent oxidoreductase
VKIGFHLPQWGPGATPEGVRQVATTTEEAGLDSVWVADHLVYPTTTSSRYPYSPDGQTTWHPEEGFLEGFSLLSWVAACTTNVQIGMSVCVLPMRHPLLVAKSAATIDVLSGGRMVLGVGTGWWEEEIEALGVSARERGRRTDEQLEIIRAAWRDGRVSWKGDFYAFDEVVCMPRPVQEPGPPIWIGGGGPRTWRRVARLGDGWHGVGSNSATIADGQEQILRARAGTDRAAEAVHVSTSSVLPMEEEDQLRRMTRLASAGVEHVVLMQPSWNDVDDFCDRIRRFARDVVPQVRALTKAA